MLKHIDYCADAQVVRVWISGRLTLADYRDLVSDLRGLAAGHGCDRLLVELQALSFRFNLLEIHELPDINAALPVRPLARTALWWHGSCPTELLDPLNYFCHRLNAEGYEAQLFWQRHDAVDWLARPA